MRAGLARGIQRGRKATLFKDERQETYVVQTGYHKIRRGLFWTRRSEGEKKRKEDGVNPSGVLGSGGGTAGRRARRVRGAPPASSLPHSGLVWLVWNEFVF